MARERYPVHGIGLEWTPLFTIELNNDAEERRAMNSVTSLQAIEAAFDTAKKRWITCDWFTEFGVAQLDLRGLTALQTERLAKATSGVESQQWQAAATWLRQVERDAAAATQAAFDACEAWAAGHVVLAKRKIDFACEIEAAWHKELVWGPLRRLIYESMELA